MLDDNQRSYVSREDRCAEHELQEELLVHPPYAIARERAVMVKCQARKSARENGETNAGARTYTQRWHVEQ